LGDLALYGFVRQAVDDNIHSEQSISNWKLSAIVKVIDSKKLSDPVLILRRLRWMSLGGESVIRGLR